MAKKLNDTSDADERNRAFLALLGQHELKVAACVHALVPSWQDAEDILQETRLQLWQEFEKFQPGSDFLAWARTIARYAVRTHFKQSQRKPLFLSGEIGDMVLDKIAKMPERPSLRMERLADCLKRLTAEALDLLQRCYVDRQKIKDIAAELGRSLAGTYSALSRTRRDLFDCMQERARRDEKP